MQTSFMHPPFGFALFYLRSVAPPQVRTSDIYRTLAVSALAGTRPARGARLRAELAGLKRAIAGGWVLGVLILVALVLALLELEIRLPDTSPDSWSRMALRVVQALIGGLLIGILEETFFRGALYSAIRRHVASARR
jgi:membrane protease YdiL (CAAX protease family)